MYKLDEVIGTEDAELVRKVIERKFDDERSFLTRNFIQALLDGWPTQEGTGLWASFRSPSAEENYVTAMINGEEIEVWSKQKGWL